MKRLFRPLSASLMISAVPLLATPLSSQFHYQGHLTENGQPANGAYDLRLTPYDSEEGGSPVAPTLTNACVWVSKGLLNTTMDFGPAVFAGTAAWLEVGVRTSRSGMPFVTLSPRQPLMAVPHAVYALQAGTVPDGSITSEKLTSGQVVRSLNGITDDVTILTGDNMSVSQQGNSVTLSATVAEGPQGPIGPAGPIGPPGPQGPEGPQGIPGSLDAWSLTGNAGTDSNVHFLGTLDDQPLELRVGGLRAFRLDSAPASDGLVNVIGGHAANRAVTIDYIQPDDPIDHFPGTIVGSTIAGGGWNEIQSYVYTGEFASPVDFSTISGGLSNQVSAALGSVIAGGGWNVVDGTFADQTSFFSTISGGSSNVMHAHYSVIGGGDNNRIEDDLAGVYYNVIGGGAHNLIGEGFQNGPANTIAGGMFNLIQDAAVSTIAGGYNNFAGFGTRLFIGGGTDNRIEGLGSDDATIGGGANNVIIGAMGAFIGGGYDNRLWDGSWESVVSGGSSNELFASSSATIGGGGSNNLIESHQSVIGGGYRNVLTGNDSVISGGRENWIGYHSGDWQSSLFADGAGIGGGVNNKLFSSYATIAGGSDNLVEVNSEHGVIMGGCSNVVHGRYALAAGRRAMAVHNGAFVWGDSTDEDVESGAANEFTVRASGGIRLFSSADLSTGVTLAAGDGSWASVSDRNAKRDFQTVDSKAVLEKVAALPLSTWSYKTQDDSVRHLGPMAQDFKAAFNLGNDDKRITSIDADGVALAAIQGLNQKLNERNFELAELRKQNADLESRLAELETAFAELRSKAE